MTAMNTNRRGALGLFAAGSLLPGLAFASAPGDKQLVVVLLRGGMDGLSAVPAYGDPDFERARAGLAGPPPGAEHGSLKLDDTFALNANLAGLHSLYGAGELLVVHAVATPYRDRSHFDGQNVLECGAIKPFGLDTGWLNRAVAGLGGSPTKPLGVALNAHMPLMMRGDAPVSSWSPSLIPTPDADTVGRLATLYGRTDPSFASAFDKARTDNAVASGADAGAGVGPLMTAAGRFLTQPDGPRVAMIEMTGWDTHAGQNGAYSPLSLSLRALDQGLLTLKTALGPAWRDTVVIVASEFGRTVAMNGTLGTDHGTGGAMFMVGGAVKGGRVLADWPGLKPGALYEARDLATTKDFRAVAAGVLRDHMGVDGAKLTAVFPDGASVRPEVDLVRT